jgi:hypothetical protein
VRGIDAWLIFELIDNILPELQFAHGQLLLEVIMLVFSAKRRLTQIKQKFLPSNGLVACRELLGLFAALPKQQ